MNNSAEHASYGGAAAGTPFPTLLRWAATPSPSESTGWDYSLTLGANAMPRIRGDTDPNRSDAS